MSGVLETIADTIGEDWAARVAAELGGRYVWIAAEPRQDNPLRQVVGLARAKAIAEALGANHSVVIPMGAGLSDQRRRRRIAALLAEGWTANRIAQTCGCHVRTVERVAARRRDPDQGDLFD